MEHKRSLASAAAVVKSLGQVQGSSDQKFCVLVDVDVSLHSHCIRKPATSLHPYLGVISRCQGRWDSVFWQSFSASQAGAALYCLFPAPLLQASSEGAVVILRSLVLFRHFDPRS